MCLRSQENVTAETSGEFGEITEEGKVRSKHKDKALVLRSQYWRETDDKRWMKTFCRTKKSLRSHISNIHIKKLAWGFIWPGYWNSLWSTKQNWTPKDKTWFFFFYIMCWFSHSSHYSLTSTKLTAWHKRKTEVQCVPVLSEKHDLIARMTRGSDQYFHRSVLRKVPNLPGPTNL